MRTKVELSAKEEAAFTFTDMSTDIHRPVLRSEFESWIAGDIVDIERCVQQLLAEANLTPSQIDRVFLTGGSSLLPALRRSFADTFGTEKVAAGDEFTSVARGLALIPRD
jgi:hypothetical chaperone protein